MRAWVAASVAVAALAIPSSVHSESSNIELPAGYRNWELVSVTALGPPFSDVRAKLGNPIAMQDFRRGTIPYRDGAIIVRLAWKQIMDPATNAGMRLEGQQMGLSAAAIAKLLAGSVEAGPPTNVQLMIKDSKRYASTGGWGFAQFTNGKRDVVITAPNNPRSCFVCHEPAKATDFVFTRYAP
ncbi:MAG TPA: cytochrome P460 family protein [Candidatus Tumulicola sp.]